MPRYFIEVAYKGTAYSGFQVQQNAVTIQSEVEKALQTFFKQTFSLTGASRTDAGVHALQNYFHFDTNHPLRGSNKSNELQPSKVPSPGGDLGEAFSPGGYLGEAFSFGGDLGKAGFTYNLNAILLKDIVIKRIFQVDENAHCRYDAVSREYKYFIYKKKDPFLSDRAYFYPYKLDIGKLNEAAEIILQHKDFTSFSKRNTQVNNFMCDVQKSEWIIEKDRLIYYVKANRFLRGMVKGLVGTMLRVGANKISLDQFDDIIKEKNCSKADFSVPSHALFLVSVGY
ncbi:MAG: tRNA pseudouridine(38-40) synthase TruA [Bacteroidota bacterium]|nr:tRNA pseudouridine(38-40) synthase TruA [Bacteroidota bacterium]